MAVKKESAAVTALKQTRNKQGAVAAIAGIIFSQLNKDSMMWMIRLFQRIGFERGLQRMIKTSFRDLARMLFPALVALVGIVALLRFISLSARLARERAVGGNPAAREKPVRADKPVSGTKPRKVDTKTPLLIGVVVTVIMIGIAAVSGGETAIASGGTLALTWAIISICLAAVKRKSGSAPARERETPEEAVSCHHATGKEKYIQQLDSYLQAGLIDRDEYRTLKERYSKLEIPEDYH